MALTGLEIYKLLPKTNCRDCGYPTCLAFAMKLAAKQASLDECPHVSDEARNTLGAASRPPIELIGIGNGENRVEIGNETVLFRHEETFHHPTALAITLRENEPAFEEKIKKINRLNFERVGQKIGVNLIALEETSGSPDDYAAAAEKCSRLSPLGQILVSDSVPCLEAALKKVGNLSPLIRAGADTGLDEICRLAREFSCPLVIRGSDLEETARRAEEAAGAGIDKLVLETASSSPRSILNEQVIVRRQALKKNFRPLGYPTITFIPRKNDEFSQALQASVLIAKYAGIIVLDLHQAEYILPLLTARQNIYTDPQKPIQMEPKLYAIGEPGPSSPLLITTNFSLTFFTVEGEIEASRIPAYLLVVDTEGTSVLTAWAADKFNPEIIRRALEEAGIEKDLDHKTLILPGYVAVLSGKLEDESGWKVLVGPKEASGIPKFLKSLK